MARETAVRMVDRAATAANALATVVFDGRDGATCPALSTPHVAVVFSPSDKTADTVIEQLVHADPDPAQITVITSDRAERETVIAAGAQAMSCASFIELCERLEQDIGRAFRKPAPPGFRPRLGDHFP